MDVPATICVSGGNHSGYTGSGPRARTRAVNGPCVSSKTTAIGLGKRFSVTREWDWPVPPTSARRTGIGNVPGRSNGATVPTTHRNSLGTARGGPKCRYFARAARNKLKHAAVCAARVSPSTGNGRQKQSGRRLFAKWKRPSAAITITRLARKLTPTVGSLFRNGKAQSLFPGPRFLAMHPVGPFEASYRYGFGARMVRGPQQDRNRESRRYGSAQQVGLTGPCGTTTLPENK